MNHHSSGDASNTRPAPKAHPRGYKLFRWTGAHRRLIEENLDKTDAQLAEMIGVNVYRLQAFRDRQRLAKPSKGRFPKGNVPHNKGKAAPWSKVGNATKGHFVKGGRPHNARPVGTIRAESNQGIWRLMVCVEHGRPKPYARWLWEKEKGPVPHGHIVRIINGKWDDVRIENLVCITRGENARLNLLSVQGERRSRMMRKGWQTRRLKQAQEASRTYSKAA